MDDDSRVIDKGWDTLPEYGPGDVDEAVTVSISTTPGEWLVNTIDAVVVPMSMVEVVEALQTHKLTERSLVWRAGMPEWAPVERVPQLTLAARMPKTAPSTAPARPATAATATPSKPPPKPVRAAPVPHPVPPASVVPQSLPSRKGTLPFGLTAPLVGQPQSRPSNPRPSSAPRVALPPAASKEEPEVLAVYSRPAATISFDLSPVQPLRTTQSAPPTPPQTLAPTTTDSTQRRAPVPRNADLSVVAASDFRQVQRSSKRLVVLSSLASAAAASLLTFALARSHASRSAAAQSQPVAAPVVTAATATPLVAAPPPSIVAVSEPVAAPEPASEASAPAPAPKPKAKASARRAKAVSAVVPARPARVEADSTRDPGSEPNPYDVKLDEDPPAPANKTPAKAPAAPHGSGLEAEATAPEASTSGAPTPGF
jgi:hypothetical protein